jgi:hypothetical protein
MQSIEYQTLPFIIGGLSSNVSKLIEFKLFFRPRITKIYFKGRYFMLRVCDKNVSTIQNTFYLLFSKE